jgi:hypothetical protein
MEFSSCKAFAIFDMDFFSNRFFGVFELHLLRSAWKCNNNKKAGKKTRGGWVLFGWVLHVYVGVRFSF